MTARPSTVTAGVMSGLFLVLLGAGVAAAPPALAVEDPTRPDARVTFGPSCRPGGLVVEVSGGTAPYHVRLATTRTPGGEDEATVAPGTTVTLRSGDVAWGETIDGRLEFTARDGSGVTFVDELENYSFTRPTAEDCAAVTGPTEPHPSPPPASTPPSDSAEPDGAAEPPSTPPPSRTSPHSSGTPQQTGGLAPTSAGASADSVAPGDTVTVHGTGFLPGERVVVRLSGTVLAAATAGPDGSVRAEIRIPELMEIGPATVNLVGDDSAVIAGVALQVAALAVTGADGAATLVPLVAAAGALVASTTGLVAAGRRRSRA